MEWCHGPSSKKPLATDTNKPRPYHAQPTWQTMGIMAGKQKSSYLTILVGKLPKNTGQINLDSKGWISSPSIGQLYKQSSKEWQLNNNAGQPNLPLGSVQQDRWCTGGAKEHWWHAWDANTNRNDSTYLTMPGPCSSSNWQLEHQRVMSSAKRLRYGPKYYGRPKQRVLHMVLQPTASQMLTDVGGLQSFISWDNFSHGFLAVNWQTQ